MPKRSREGSCGRSAHAVEASDGQLPATSPPPSSLDAATATLCPRQHVSPPASLADPLSTSLVPADVVFPPALLSDFVIHYHGTAFLVHKFVLHLHSAYFRALFLALPPATTPSAHSADCQHPHIAHCVHIPTQQEPATNSPLTADDFCELLCHLYYPAHYRYPLYLPHDDVDLSDEQSFACILLAIRCW